MNRESQMNNESNKYVNVFPFLEFYVENATNSAYKTELDKLLQLKFIITSLI